MGKGSRIRRENKLAKKLDIPARQVRRVRRGRVANRADGKPLADGLPEPWLIRYFTRVPAGIPPAMARRIRKGKE